MIYNIEISKSADNDFKFFKTNHPILYTKIKRILIELSQNPRIGVGKPKRLKGFHDKEIWSRRLDRKHRIVYCIEESRILIYIYSARGHYSDK